MRFMCYNCNILGSKYKETDLFTTTEFAGFQRNEGPPISG